MFSVDLTAVRALFDEQMRRNAPPGPDSQVERDANVTRSLALDGSWAAVLWSDLTDSDADAVVAAETARDVPYLEWKHYAGDRPSDLPDRLVAAGLTPQGPETVLIADLTELEPAGPAPHGVRVTTVDDEAGVGALVRVHEEVFGDLHPGTRTSVLTSLPMDPRPVQAVVAWAGERPIAAGRIEFSEGRDFAGLFGGGTAAEWRGKGVFRALVAHRAARARARGVRYLYVDAVPMSRPVFERLGFVPLTETTPYVRER
jgi:GNAT superfamily N-acetyltransferase